MLEKPASERQTGALHKSPGHVWSVGAIHSGNNFGLVLVNGRIPGLSLNQEPRENRGGGPPLGRKF